VAPDLAFNTAVSFVTNTNWQNYGGETTMSYLQPDGRADGAELRLGRDRHRAGRRAVRGFARARQDASAISGST
jgi:K+-transporting ATPase ATPase A chain